MSAVTHLRPPSQTLSQRIATLQAEATGLAREHLAALCASMAETQRLASEVAEGGDAYPVGVRDLARRLAEDTDAKISTINAISARAG